MVGLQYTNPTDKDLATSRLLARFGTLNLLRRSRLPHRKAFGVAAFGSALTGLIFSHDHPFVYTHCVRI